MVRVEYRAGVLDSVRAMVPTTAQRLFDIEATAQRSSTGAWISVDGIETLFVPLDFNAIGSYESIHTLQQGLDRTRWSLDQLALQRARDVPGQNHVERMRQVCRGRS